jgi:hypothetical protein
VTPGVSEVNSNVGVRSGVEISGVSVSLVTGAVRMPIVQLYSAGVASTLPSAPRARTENVCSPIARPVYVTPEVQGTNPSSLSSAHSNVAPVWFASKVNVADVLSISAAGNVRIVDSGGGVTRQLWTAGVGSTLPAASRAMTRSWCTPTARPVSCSGEVHELNEAPSTEHWNVEPGSFETKVSVALVLAVSAAGPLSIVVSGAVVSGGAWIVQL